MKKMKMELREFVRERENESEVREVSLKVSYNWAFIVVSNFGINAQRVFLVFGKR